VCDDNGTYDELEKMLEE
jgi:hypothetical protein